MALAADGELRTAPAPAALKNPQPDAAPHPAAPLLRTAATTVSLQDLREAPLPVILSEADTETYERLFRDQEQARWATADQEIAGLGNKLLLGDVLAQRYRDRRYHPTYAQLASWLKDYGDQPGAKAIYARALARHHRGEPLPTKPSDTDTIGQEDETAAAEDDTPAAPLADPAAAVAAEIRSIVEAQPRQAQLLLASADGRKLSRGIRAALQNDIARSYIAAGALHEALAMSAAAKDEHDPYAPMAHWNAGIADWRLGRYAEAGRHFEALARRPNQSSWTTSAAAFWAARAAIRDQDAEHVAYWLGVAAEHPRTFYGLIARRMLGVDSYLNFDADTFTGMDAQLVESLKPVRRAVALLAVGQRSLGTDALRALADRGGASMVELVEAIADQANLPALSLQLAAVLADGDGRNHDDALYPVPRWTPRGGFAVDRALVFALMRQESLFLPAVKSTAGALGLMQLMPATARLMAERTGLTIGARRQPAEERLALINPELNLTLAQEYIETLLQNDSIRGNLILFACAYNAGPGAALHWYASQPQYRDDPLLFLESIPYQETRTYVQRVLTNYWIYRQRLHQGAPDLDALASGQWPIYTAEDPLPANTLSAENSIHAPN